jgi:acyl carrier protein
MMETEKKQTDRIEILKTLAAILEPWLDDIDDSASLNEETNLLADLGLDSVAILQLVLGIEKDFGVTIKDSELDSDVFSKMKNLIDIIEDKLNEAN